MITLYFSVILNAGSLVLGVCAWIFAGLAISTPNMAASYKNTLCSFSLCMISLVCQLFEVGNRANVGDYAAIEDTICAVLLAASVLSVVTLVLNLVALAKAGEKK